MKENKVVVDGNKVELVRPGEDKQTLRVKKVRKLGFMSRSKQKFNVGQAKRGQDSLKA